MKNEHNQDTSYLYPSDFPTTEKALAFFCRYGMEVEIHRIQWEKRVINDWVLIGNIAQHINSLDYKKYNYVRTLHLTHESQERITDLGWNVEYQGDGETSYRIGEYRLAILKAKTVILNLQYLDEQKYPVFVCKNLPTIYDLKHQMEVMDI